MSRSVPNWVDEPKPCPVDGCDGQWWIDVGGSPANPVTERPATCAHLLERCTNCGDLFDISDPASEQYTAASAPERSNGFMGEWVSYCLCAECNTVETVIREVPSWILEQGEAEKIPDYEPEEGSA